MDYITLEYICEQYDRLKTEPQQFIHGIKKIHDNSSFDWKTHYVLSCFEKVCNTDSVPDMLIHEVMEEFMSRTHLFTSVN